ncbi:hypothetical protein HK096_000683, partial [Nowakowskiella sp. JEL0078]
HSPFKEAARVAILTDCALYVLDLKGFTLKDRMSLDDISGISLSSLQDGVIVIHADGNSIKRSQTPNTSMENLKVTGKGDILLNLEQFAIEFASRLYISVKAYKKSPRVVVDTKLLYTVEKKISSLNFRADVKATKTSVKKTGENSFEVEVAI